MVKESNDVYVQLFYRRDCGGGMVCSSVAGAARTTGARGNVSEYSLKASWRLFDFLRSCVAEYKYMTTLTYPADFPSNGREVKAHLGKFLTKFMKWNASACWFLEFQKRGAPHFHILHTHFTPKHEVSIHWAAANGEWHAIKTMTRVEKLRSGHHGAIGYAVKYAIKGDQKEVPEGYEAVGRFWGVRGDRRVRRVTTKIRWEKGGAECAAAAMEALKWGEARGEVELSYIEGSDGCYFRPSNKGQSFLQTETFKRIELQIAKKVAQTGAEVSNEGDLWGSEVELWRAK